MRKGVNRLMSQSVHGFPKNLLVRRQAVWEAQQFAQPSPWLATAQSPTPTAIKQQPSTASSSNQLAAATTSHSQQARASTAAINRQQAAGSRPQALRPTSSIPLSPTGRIHDYQLPTPGGDFGSSQSYHQPSSTSTNIEQQPSLPTVAATTDQQQEPAATANSNFYQAFSSRPLQQSLRPPTSSRFRLQPSARAGSKQSTATSTSIQHWQRAGSPTNQPLPATSPSALPPSPLAVAATNNQQQEPVARLRNLTCSCPGQTISSIWNQIDPDT
ncbi:hypothetical protein N7G274_010476 [Stereocaulon virgatum]|uniref:Uncharacterized protein n=1 Tax=Stereocaulon virgatum TaxID=373712 RepID=A0ABR3ZXG1_9LECA